MNNPIESASTQRKSNIQSEFVDRLINAKKVPTVMPPIEDLKKIYDIHDDEILEPTQVKNKNESEVPITIIFDDELKAQSPDPEKLTRADFAPEAIIGTRIMKGRNDLNEIEFGLGVETIIADDEFAKTVPNATVGARGSSEYRNEDAVLTPADFTPTAIIAAREANKLGYINKKEYEEAIASGKDPEFVRAMISRRTPGPKAGSQYPDYFRIEPHLRVERTPETQPNQANAPTFNEEIPTVGDDHIAETIEVDWALKPKRLSREDFTPEVIRQTRDELGLHHLNVKDTDEETKPNAARTAPHQTPAPTAKPKFFSKIFSKISKWFR